MGRQKADQRVYAVVRHDRYQDGSAPIEIQIKVVRVFVNESDAEAKRMLSTSWT